MYSTQRCYWPQQATQELHTANGQQDPLLRAVLLQRLSKLRQAQDLLLACLALNPSELRALELLCGLRLRQGRQDEAEQLLQRATELDASTTQTDPFWLLRRGQITLLSSGADQLAQAAPPAADAHPLLHWLQLQAFLLTKEQTRAEAFIAAHPPEEDFPEALELRARVHFAAGRHDQAIHCLEPLLERCPGSLPAWLTVIDINQAAGRDLGFVLATAQRHHPRSTALATAETLHLLMQRQPSRARSAVLSERVGWSLNPATIPPAQSDSNLFACYDHTGRSDLVSVLHPRLENRLEQVPGLHANRTMQLASQLAPGYSRAVQRLARSFAAPPAMPWHQRPGSSKRVAFISPDLHYHPVGRFLLMQLEAGLGSHGDLHVVHTSGRVTDATTRSIAAAAERQGHFHNLVNQSPREQLEFLRELNLDVAVDLAGWTSDNNGHLFGPRIAPLQANWLGYFASSGLPAMDLWIGDHAVFPTPMQEWHSESIVRLERPFLAWQPCLPLAEAEVDVPAALPRATPITFGCFNHLRKLGLPTLRLWARILAAIPQARLALKAFTTDDPGVVSLLRQRMLQAGLDPERVTWLPTCPNVKDHLRQYGLLDVALDPFPNGGCTTTCEALWMGVPVITLRGSHYVSRMATAVLAGAGCHQWIAETEEAYLQLAIQAADQLTALRADRAQWRTQLQASPLGDAAGLNQALWGCLAEASAARR